MSTTLLHTSEGTMPLHEAIESEPRPVEDKIIAWEAIRNLCMTFGARDGLDMAIKADEERRLK